MRSIRIARWAGLLMIAGIGIAGAQPMPPGNPPPPNPPMANPPAAPMPTNNPAAAANVRESEQYSALLRSNPAFRRQREKIECGPIADAQLRASCIASFEAYATSPPPKRRGR